MDDRVSVYISEEDIKNKIKQLGAQITKDYEGKTPILVSVLKGSFVFMADLARAIDLNCPVDFMVVSSYGSGTATSGSVKIIKDLQVDIAGKDIIIIEDILDSGVTLSNLRKMLGERGANSIKICTLLDKPARRVADVTPDYKGFTIDDKFIVGYGLDYAEMYRNLPFIGVLDPKVYS